MEGESLEIVALQTYVTFSRKIENNQQKVIEVEKTLQLSRTGITGESKRFLIKNVFDVSYRFCSTDYGFLYLHTNSGVVSFYIKTISNDFIDEFKKIKNG